MNNFLSVKVKSLEGIKETEEFSLKKLHKRHIESTYYFSKKGFDKFRDESEVRVIGNVRVRQHRYVDPEKTANPEKVYKKKKQKKIIGVCDIKVTDEYFNERRGKLNDYPYSRFDLYESKNKSCCGYAWVGEKKYVRLVKRNPVLIILFILICVALLLFGLKSCNKNDTGNELDLADQSKYHKKEDDVKSNEITDMTGIYLNKSYTVDGENRTVQLVNYEQNDVYLCYDVYMDDTFLGSTGAFKPGYKVDYDLYSLLLKKGTHRIVFKIKSYDLKTKEPLAVYNNPVDIIVN